MIDLSTLKSRWAAWLRTLCALSLVGVLAAPSVAAPRKPATAKPVAKAPAQKATAAKAGSSATSRSAKSTARTGKAATASKSAARSSIRSTTSRSGKVTSGSRSARASSVQRRSVVRIPVAPPRLSFGQLYGLHEASDPLDLKSSVAFVIDQDTNEVLLNKNSSAVLPIASITKLMTALVVTEANLPMDDVLSISQDDIDTEKGSSSRLQVGTQLTRGEMLHLALMSSENRAANALGRHYPGGATAFVAAMNAKAKVLGMGDTRYVEPTGLSSRNQSSAMDLATLVKAAYRVPLIRELSTSPEHQVFDGQRQLQYRTTNRLVLSPDWDIGLQKTGYISEAGQCLVMQARLAGRKFIMVLLDSAGKYSRIGDAERIRQWLISADLTSQRGTVGAPLTAAMPAAGH